MKPWIEIAKELPVGQKTRRDCPQCGEGTNTNAAIVNHAIKGYSLYCLACGYNPFESKGIMTLAELAHIKELNEYAEQATFDRELPADFTREIPLHGRLWLYKGGLTETVWKRHSIGYSEFLDRVILPVYDAEENLIWFQGRALSPQQKPKYLQPSAERREVIYAVKPDGADRQVAVIVEDILSAIRVGKHIPTYSLLGTKITTAQAVRLGRYDHVVTWLDPDKGGTRGSRAVRKTLGMLTEVSDLTTEVDPKNLSDKQIKEALKEFL